jgi:hypothetical protein
LQASFAQGDYQGDFGMSRQMSKDYYKSSNHEVAVRWYSMFCEDIVDYMCRAAPEALTTHEFTAWSDRYLVNFHQESYVLSAGLLELFCMKYLLVFHFQAFI